MDESCLPTHALLVWLPCKTVGRYSDSMYPLTSFGIVQLEDEGSSGHNAGTSRKKIPEEEEDKNQAL